ncbi:MAG: hypothetical protein QOH78_1368, partial [Verrucomicrobiota bacterium]
SKAAPQAEAPPLVEQEPRVETPREESRSEPTDADGKKKFVKSYGS